MNCHVDRQLVLRFADTSLGISALLSICPSGGVDFLQTMKTPDTNCSNLLITTKEGLILLRGQDLEPHWTLELQNISRLRTRNIFLSYIFLYRFLPFTCKHMCCLENIEKNYPSLQRNLRTGDVQVHC